MHVICESPASEFWQCEWDQVPWEGWHNWTIKSSTVSLAHLVLETSLCSWLGWLKSIRERKWIFYQVGLLAFDMDVYDEHKSVWTTFKTTGTACMWCIQHYFCVIASVTQDRRPETIARTQTNATKTHLHEGKMLRHYSSMVSLRAAVTTKGRHQQTFNLRHHQR